MATAKDFIDRLGRINNVAGCLLVKQDGTLISTTVNDPERYVRMMVTCRDLVLEASGDVSVGSCCCLGFHGSGESNFYIFPINTYVLGVFARSAGESAKLLSEIRYLISRVTIGTPRS